MKLVALLERAVSTWRPGTNDKDNDLERFVGTTNRFHGTISLDPGDLSKSWDRLATDTTLEEIATMPSIMHAALVSTLKERGPHLEGWGGGNMPKEGFYG